MIKTLLILLPLTLFAGLLDNLFPFQTIEKANNAYRLREYNKSIKLFDSLKKDDPSVDYNQANAEYKVGKYDSALLSYHKAKGVDEATRQHNIGNIYFKKKDWDMAIKHYEFSLAVREDKDTRFNLELAKRKKEEKNKDKKKEDEDKKKEEEQKKKDQEQEDKKKKEQEKKKGQEKENDKNKKSDEQEAKDAKKKEKQDKMTQKEKLTQKELKRLMKKLNDKKMPTMMYQTSPENRGERDDKNPW